MKFCNIAKKDTKKQEFTCITKDKNVHSGMLLGCHYKVKGKLGMLLPERLKMFIEVDDIIEGNTTL